MKAYFEEYGSMITEIIGGTIILLMLCYSFLNPSGMKSIIEPVVNFIVQGG